MPPIINIKKISTAFGLIKESFSGYKKQFWITLVLGFLGGLFTVVKLRLAKT